MQYSKPIFATQNPMLQILFKHHHKNATNRTLHWNLDKVNIWVEKKCIDFNIKQGLTLNFTKM